MRPLMALLFLVFALGCVVAVAPVEAGVIPPAAQQHQRELTRLARQEFGMSAPVALFAAQIHQESSWRTHARSPYAEGLAQFTPDTATWISEIYPDLGAAAPYSPGWAIRAMLRYNRHLLSRVKPWYARDVPACDRWAFALSAYNGGPGWLPRDRRLAEAAGADPDRWWGHVEYHTARADWARRENRHYPHRILFELEPRYRTAGWAGAAPCP
ncbi:MAG: transglycosylase SLT domain-containing protein [Marinobacter sp.]|nr:transglycosylase SLT domain-containing protein [Marinobacter sp.]